MLVDTSAWIAYFRETDAGLCEHVDEIVSDDAARICGLVVAELLQGARYDREITELCGFAATIRFLDEPKDAWERAGKLGYKLRRQGRTVHINDCYIAVMALANDSEILTLDKHFQVIAGVEDLKLREWT